MNYYTILGISPEATPPEIRAAYRRLAKAYHPDHCPGGSELFRQVQEAYTVLKKPQNGCQYASRGRVKRTPAPETPPGFGGPEPLIPEDGTMVSGKIRYGPAIEPLSPLNTPVSKKADKDDLFQWIWDAFFI